MDGSVRHLSQLRNYMSDFPMKYDSSIEINDQKIKIHTEVADEFRCVSYDLTSELPMEPSTVAVSLYLMCLDVCAKLDIDIDELVEGLEDSPKAMGQVLN